MKLMHEQVVCGIVITGLMAIGLVMVEEPEFPRWLSGATFKPHEAEILSDLTVSRVDWSADGRRLFSQSRGAKNAYHTIALHDLQSGEGYIPDWAEPLCGTINHASISRSGNNVAISTRLGELWWLDIETAAATQMAILSPQAWFVAAAISPDGRFVAGASRSGDVYVCNALDGSTRSLNSNRMKSISKLRFAGTGDRLLCIRCDGTITVWQISTGEVLSELDGYDSTPNAAAFLPEGNQIISLSGTTAIQVWDATSGITQWRGSEGTQGRYGIATMDTASTRPLAAWGGGMNHRIIVWDLENQRMKFDIENPSVVLSLKFSPDGSKLAVAGRENVIRIYDMTNGTEVQRVDVQRAFDVEARI